MIKKFIYLLSFFLFASTSVAEYGSLEWGTSEWSRGEYGGEWGESADGLTLLLFAPLLYDLDLDTGSGDPTFDRSTEGSVKDYVKNVVTCDIDEARFQGARRIHGVTTDKPHGFWSDQGAENAILFDNTDDNIIVSDESNVRNIFDGGSTFAAWIYVKGDGEDANGRITDKDSNCIIFVNDVSSGSIKFRLIQRFTGADGFWGTTAYDLPLNQWNHVVIVYNSGDVINDPTFYINNVKKTIGDGITQTGTPGGTREDDTGSDLYIGNVAANSGTFDGYIDNIKIWKGTELTDAQVEAEYLAGTKTTSAVSTTSWWKLDDTDSSITDYSGNGNTGAFRNNTTPASPTNVDGRYNDGVTLTTLDGILLEEERENIVDYSESLDNATGGWAENGVAVTLNDSLSPDGINTTGSKIDETAINSFHGISKTFAGLPDNTDYTMSCFFKKGERDWSRLTWTTKSGSLVRAWFDLDNGVLGTVEAGGSAIIESFGNGWYRCSLATDMLSGGSSPIAYILVAKQDNENTYLGVASTGISAWGAQVEAGSMATSYIVSNSGGTASRTVDILSYVATSNVSGIAGSIVCDFNILGFDASSTPGIISISDNSASDFINLEGLSTNNNAIASITAASVSKALITSSNDDIVPNSDQSIGMTYQVGSAEGWIDGSSFGTDTPASLPTGFTKIYIGATEQGADTLNGTTKNVYIYSGIKTDMGAATTP